MKTLGRTMQQSGVIARNVGLLLVGFMLWTGIAVCQFWDPLVNQPTFAPSNPMLLPNGNVMVQESSSGDWWILKPDVFGVYKNGGWSKAATMPSGYGPTYYASAILKNDEMITMGGEYNFGVQDDTNLGAIYNPTTNKWKSMGHPSGVSSIGDAPGVVLANGTFMMGDCCDSTQWLLDLATSTWTATGTGKADANSEEGWTLLPNGKVLTVDTENGTNSELYNPATGSWSSAGSTIVPLGNACGGFVAEVGPAVLRPDGTVFATGGTGNTAVYNSKTGKWSKGPAFPAGLGVMDGPGALMINGNVLVGAAPTSPKDCAGVGTQYFEFDGTNLNSVPAPPNAKNDKSYFGRMINLPSGHVLFTDGTADVEIYTPKGTWQTAWQPTITSFPSTITRGKGNVIKGTQFNGLSQGVMYGDDTQAATNFPLVRVTNNSSGHVFYARTYAFSTMGVATGSKIVSCSFVVPTSAETGASTLEVVANGIPSTAVAVTIN